MDRELDLQKLFLSLLLRWRLLVVMPTFLVVLTLIIVLIAPPGYQASASIAVVKAETQVGFGSNIKTITEEDLALSGFVRPTADDTRLQSFVSLVTNSAIAETVIEQLKDQLPLELRTSAELLRNVEGELITGGDLIAIRVSNADPALAATVANAWAKEYERYVNNLYASNLPDFSQTIQDEYDRTRLNYDTAQLAVEDYVANNQVDELSRQVDEKRQVMAALQEQSLTAVKAVINERLNRNANVVLQYLRGQNTATETVISSRFDEQFKELAHYYSVKIGMRNLIEQAETLRDQIAQSGASGANTNVLSLLLFKAGLFAGDGVPGDLQFNLGNLADLATTSTAQVTDVEAVISALEKRLTLAEAEIAKLERNLLNGTGFEDLPESVAQDTPIQQIANAQINRIFDLEGMDDLDRSFIDTPIAKRIKQFEDDIIVLRGQIEREQARGRDLTMKRDLAWEAFTNLARKQQEVSVSDQVQGGEVRFAAPAYPPLTRSMSRVLILLAVGIVGFILAAMLALFVGAINIIIPLTKLFGREQAWHNRLFRWLVGEDISMVQHLRTKTAPPEQASSAE